MSYLPKTIEKLMEIFQKLPGIGPKTASRLTFYMMHMPQSELDLFAHNISTLKSAVQYCSVCSNLAESDPCPICSDITREIKIVCVVENPLDLLSIERTGKFRGVYHVLHGAINPLNNIGPEQIKIDQLLERLKKGLILEVVLATNPNMEGEATAMYLKREILNLKTQRSKLNGIKITRLAHGLPVGADLEYADEVTLSRALEGRTLY